MKKVINEILMKYETEEYKTISSKFFTLDINKEEGFVYFPEVNENESRKRSLVAYWGYDARLNEIFKELGFDQFVSMIKELNEETEINLC